MSLDSARIEACLAAPESGPRTLFFSGGSALKGVSRVLRQYTHNSIHLITPFDSGGSSAVLREAFGMFGVGDVRNRLLALAEDGDAGGAAVVRLMAHRLATDVGSEQLVAELQQCSDGSHPLAADIPSAACASIGKQLDDLRHLLPPDFDLRGASIGNLVFSAAYLAGGRDIECGIQLFTRLLRVHGNVRPTSVVDAQLVALHADDQRTTGQHHFHEGAWASEARVVDLELLRGDSGLTGNVAADECALEWIGEADLICYPMGSFFSSVLANLLPAGVGQAIHARSCPKVFVPNASLDPEMKGYCLSEAVLKLVEFVRRDAGQTVAVEDVVDSVLIDPGRLNYAFDLDLDRVAQLGVAVLETPLAGESAERVAPHLLVRALLSLLARSSPRDALRRASKS